MAATNPLNIDVTFEILLRLPTKTLGQFKLVSKPWRSLISSEFFINAHLRRTQSQPTTTHNLILAASTLTSIEQRFQGSYSSNRILVSPLNMSITPRDTDYDNDSKGNHIGIGDGVHIPLPYPDDKLDHIKIVGSSNGLVCLYVGFNRTNISANSFFIFNPCTREYRQVPKLNNDAFNSDGRSRHLFYGFGYDSLHDDYKLIVGLCKGLKFPSQIGVFALKADYWRFTYDSPHVIVVGPVHLLNGALHWRADFFNILSFNLAEEKFTVILTPDERLCAVGVFRGCLCVAQDELKNGKVVALQLWTMKEYGVKESWTLLSRFQPMSSFYFISQFSILACPVNTDIIFFVNTTDILTAYNLKEGSFTIRRIASHVYHVVMFLESLVSPHRPRGFNKEVENNIIEAIFSF